MREYQKCRRCGRIFAQIDRSGSPISVMSESMRRAEEKECPDCGGPVIWVDNQDSPLSENKQMEEANRHLRMGCLWSFIALILVYVLYHFARK